MTFSRKILLGLLCLVLIGWGGSSWLSAHYAVPILMYHKVETAPEPLADVVSPENLRRQMDYLRRIGVRVIPLSELVEALRAGRPQPSRSVVITFDDGYENNFTQAYPILKEYQYPATLFISPDFFQKDGFLTVPELKTMHSGGRITYGSHGMDQAYLPDLTPEQRKREVGESKRILEAVFGAPVDYYAYPVGGYSDPIQEELRQAGYRAAVTTNRGRDRLNRKLYELNRLRISDKDQPDWLFWLKTSGFYQYFCRFKNPY